MMTHIRAAAKLTEVDMKALKLMTTNPTATNQTAINQTAINLMTTNQLLTEVDMKALKLTAINHPKVANLIHILILRIPATPVTHIKADLLDMIHTVVETIMDFQMEMEIKQIRMETIMVMETKEIKMETIMVIIIKDMPKKMVMEMVITMVEKLIKMEIIMAIKIMEM